MHNVSVTVYTGLMSNLLTISDVANFLSVSVDTIRRWEKKGLIKSSRDENNYRVFDPEEIERVNKKKNGAVTKNHYKILKAKKLTEYTSIELFAGAGGTALGFENAGIRHILLNEYDKNAVATLKANRPDWNIIHDDVENLDFKKWHEKIDVVQGGFPCQSFSYAGNKRGFEDTRGTLFYEFARCIKEVKPKIAVGENVKGLLRHDKGRTLSTMVNVLQEIGYRVAYKVLKSQYHDVPQKRERLIIIGIRNDLDLPIFFPKEKNYIISIKDALENCPKSIGQEYSDYKKRIMEMIPEGGYWKDLPVGIQKEYMKKSFYHSGGKTGMARRLSWDEPSLTLTCSPSQKQTERCHPSETRPLTIREYARIQTFPDEWKFEGSVTSQYKQIGNAVPVNLGYHLGRAVIKMLNNERRVDDMQVYNETKNEKPHQTSFVFS